MYRNTGLSIKTILLEIMSTTIQTSATVTGHNITDGARIKQENGYCSSVTCTTEAGSFRTVWRKINPPPIGSIVIVEYKNKNARGIPIRARIISFPEKDIDICDLLAKCQIGLKKDKVALSAPAVSLTDVPKDGKIMDSKTPVKSGSLAMKAGEKVYILASSKEGGYHVVSKPKAGGKVYCSCPAWRFQKLPAAERTCKHCDLVTMNLE